jgi:hypothetical protein
MSSNRSFKSMNSELHFELFGDRGEDSDQLVGFVGDRIDVSGGKRGRRNGEFKPVNRLLQFFQAIAQFGYKFSIRSGACRFAEVRAHRSSGTKELFTDNLCDYRAIEALIQSNDCNGVSTSPDFQIVIHDPAYCPSISLNSRLLKNFPHFHGPQLLNFNPHP